MSGEAKLLVEDREVVPDLKSAAGKSSQVCHLTTGVVCSFPFLLIFDNFHRKINLVVKSYS